MASYRCLALNGQPLMLGKKTCDLELSVASLCQGLLRFRKPNAQKIVFIHRISWSALTGETGRLDLMQKLGRAVETPSTTIIKHSS